MSEENYDQGFDEGYYQGLSTDKETSFLILAARIDELKKESEKLRAENNDIREALAHEQKTAITEIEKLRAALKLFQPYSIPKNAADTDDLPVLIGDLRAAAAALKETGDE